MKDRKTTLVRLTLLFGAFAAAGLLFADAPAMIHYQGKLTDAAGVPEEGPKAIEFNLYGSKTGPDRLQMVPKTVQLRNGVFSVTLEFSPVHFQSNTSLYLAVNIQGGSQLGARQQLVAVPYALAVASSSISSAEIKDNTITNADIAADAGIETSKLNGLVTAIANSGLGPLATASVVTESMIGNSQVTAVKLSSSSFDDSRRAVGESHIRNNAVTALKLAPGAVEERHIKDGQITPLKIATGAVESRHIKGGNLLEVHFAKGAVTDIKLSSSPTDDTLRAVTANHIQDNAVTKDKIEDGAVTTDKVLNGTLQAEDFATGAISDVQLSSSSIDDTLRAVTANHIRKNAVTKDKIEDDAVTTDKVLNGTLQAEDFATGAISDVQLSSSSIDDTLRAVTANHIRNNAVTKFKLNLGVGDQLAVCEDVNGRLRLTSSGGCTGDGTKGYLILPGS